MPWNGSGNFSRIFSWVADKAAGLDISSSRTDTDTGDITSNGFGNTLTRDGQGQPTANLPMAGFRHTGVQNAINRSDYAAFGQLQDGLTDWTIAGGTADAITATYTPALTVLSDGQLCFFRASAANATTAPTFAPNGLTARPITRTGGSALAVAGAQFLASDIPGNLSECILRYNVANTRWELLNPGNSNLNQGALTTGAVTLTLATSAPSGWLLFDDGTFGSATSGSSNSNNVLNLALFTLMFNNLSDTYAPLLTSAGAGTTRAGQGTAAAAWAANCRMTLPKTLGRALGVAGAGSGLTARALGATTGAETHAIVAGEVPSLTAVNASQAISVATSGVNLPGSTGTIADTNTGSGGNLGAAHIGGTAFAAVTTMSGANSISATYTNGSQTALALMQPSSFLNAMVKQ